MRTSVVRCEMAEWRGLASPLLGLLASQSNFVLTSVPYFFPGGALLRLIPQRIKMAEWRGFEPPIRYYPYNGLANRRLQPLGHHSVSSPSRHEAEGC